MKIFCCTCEGDVSAVLVSGKEIYPYTKRFNNLPFWQCPTCKNYVGCHHKTKDRTRPLGCIPNAEIRAVRKKIHNVLDPLYKRRLISRSKLYKRVAKEIGKKSYHTANVKSVTEGEQVLEAVRKIEKELSLDPVDWGFPNGGS